MIYILLKIEVSGAAVLGGVSVAVAGTMVWAVIRLF